MQSLRKTTTVLNFKTMKKVNVVIFYISLFVVAACKNGYESAQEVNPTALNNKIASGIQQKAAWVETPESIVQELFPRSVHEEGNAYYMLEDKLLPDATRRITITEEGPLDDEVNGERTIINFQFMNGRWEITKMTYAARRRY